MSTPMVATREALGDMPNPLGLQGIEFIEYATSRPQALGQALERMGFQPVARHRSREVLLYRQGDMNIIVNAHQDTERTGVHAPPALTETPVLAACAAGPAPVWRGAVHRPGPRRRLDSLLRGAVRFCRAGPRPVVWRAHPWPHPGQPLRHAALAAD